MACGKPIVTTHLGVAFDSWLEKCACAILVPPDDESEFAAAIIRLLRESDVAREMGQRGRQAAVECCSWTKVVEQTVQFIRSHPRWNEPSR
jgi:glycosyltransferase involved in cell wall biosynthesis